MTTTTKHNLLLKGYELVAHDGFIGLKVETLANKAYISKSSFYHHFGTLEAFIELLLEHHLQQCKQIAYEESQCKTINPELITVLLNYKTDLLFHRQLRFYRDHAVYKDVLERSNTIIGNSFITLLKQEPTLNFSLQQMEHLFDLGLENFFLKMTPKNFSYEWLMDYFNQLIKTLKSLSPK